MSVTDRRLIGLAFMIIGLTFFLISFEYIVSLLWIVLLVSTILLLYIGTVIFYRNRSDDKEKGSWTK